MVYDKYGRQHLSPHNRTAISEISELAKQILEKVDEVRDGSDPDGFVDADEELIHDVVRELLWCSVGLIGKKLVQESLRMEFECDA